jgi:hypothetical protein
VSEHPPRCRALLAGVFASLTPIFLNRDYIPAFKIVAFFGHPEIFSFFNGEGKRADTAMLIKLAALQDQLLSGSTAALRGGEVRREVPARYEAVQHFPPPSTGFDRFAKARRPRFLQRSIVPHGVR